MKKILVGTATLLLTIGLLAPAGSAEGLFGKRYLSVGYGNLMPGDDRDKAFDDAVSTLRATVNFPVMEKLDAFASLGYAERKWYLDPTAGRFSYSAKTKRIDAGVAYQFFPEQAFNPFVRATIGYVSTDSDYDGESVLAEELFPKDTQNDFAYSVGGGVEVPFAERFSAAPGLRYEKTGDEDDFLGGFEVTGWFNETIFAGLGFEYGFDKGDFSYLGTVGFSF